MSSGEKETGRVEAFSDGVFAIAITLLVLDLKVPLAGDGPLTPRLLAQWPGYLAFLTSFATIGIMWMNHHHLFGLVRRVDHGLQIWNMLLLLGVSFVPFPTATLAAHLLGSDGRVAALFYAATYVVIAVFFNGLWRHARSPGHAPPLLHVAHDSREVREVSERYRWGVPVYALTWAIAWASPVASVALNLALAVWFAIPYRPREAA